LIRWQTSMPSSLRHHDVEQDQVRQMLLGGGERLLAVSGLLEARSPAGPSRAIRMSRLVSLSSTMRMRGGLCMTDWTNHFELYFGMYSRIFASKARGTVGLGDVGVAAGVARLALVAGERIGGDDDDRNAFELRHGLDPARRFVAVHDRKLDVHQDQVGLVSDDGGQRLSPFSASSIS
jgi:hypothetical protein